MAKYCIPVTDEIDMYIREIDTRQADYSRYFCITNVLNTMNRKSYWYYRLYLILYKQHVCPK